MQLSGRWLALLALVSSVGCAPGRVADLKDSGRISFGLSLGLTADAKIGDFTHPALGVVGSSAMLGFESRDIDGTWYEARVSDPFAIYWYRREGAPWSQALLSSGWRGVWESLDWLDAIDELDEPIDRDALPETGTVYKGEMLDGKLSESRWLPLPGPSDKVSPLWSFNSATDLQLGASVLLIGGRVGFNLLEFLDFLLGFGGLDIAGDDPAAEAAAPSSPEPQ